MVRYNQSVGASAIEYHAMHVSVESKTNAILVKKIFLATYRMSDAVGTFNASRAPY